MDTSLFWFMYVLIGAGCGFGYIIAYDEKSSIYDKIGMFLVYAIAWPFWTFAAITIRLWDKN